MAVRRPLVRVSGEDRQLPDGDTLPVSKADVGLGNVQNVDQTNAGNLSTGTVPIAQIPDAVKQQTAYLGSVQDPNTQTAPWFISNHSNGPGSGFYYIANIAFNTNRGQLAIPYQPSTAPRTIFFRFLASGVWGSWVPLYGMQNVLGTVSQSSGVPTGSIIERGSNANGEYVRFADGTQICTRAFDYSAAINISWGGAFTSEWQSWTYPAVFVSGSVPNQWASSPSAAFFAYNSVSNTSGQFRPVQAISEGSISRRIYLTAIGRWF